MDDISPFSLTFLRWVGALLPLVLIAWVAERPELLAIAKALPQLLLLSCLGMLMYAMLMYSALELIEPVPASMVGASTPAVLAVLGALMAGERLNARLVIGIGVSLVGVIIVISGGNTEALFLTDFSRGHVYMVGVVVAWSLYSIWGRVPGVPPITAVAVQAAIAVLVMLPFVALFGIEAPSRSATGWALLFIALVPSVACYVLWSIALRLTPSGHAGVFLNLAVFSSVGLAVVFGYKVTVADLTGGAFVIAGVLVSSVSAARQPPPSSPEPL
ncbi:drug/metabolite transporter (DMT)-like permease [Nesterenkonia lutea]|uniref:Drug/metabolite transporter (DMT)-like permease n=1 Tax=Nesterenkonia lutea TaxID=272919 RepID=A0ABR9JIB2_9MICC|nr:drug/metabolite transporter (DMT)-like permease [Nesterenkonia lutea]